MKHTFSVTLFFAVLMCTSCGSSSPAPKTINGVWRAQLNNSDGSSAYMFFATFSQMSGMTVSVSNLAITSPSPCFNAPSGQTATFAETGSSNGFQTGPFTMTVNAGAGAQANTLSLTGNRGNDGNFSGTWTSTGFAGCDGNGSFTMSPPPTP